METLTSILLGIGLSAACGFRVFVPLLVVSAAGLMGWLPLAPGFEWLGTMTALLTFAAATVLEVAAYYVPWVDNALDGLAAPLAMLAGAVLMASVLVDVSPFWRWTLTIIAGGGMAATVQAATTTARAGSSALTLGLANPLFATMELGASLLVTVLAIAIPALFVLSALVIVLWVTWRLVARRRAPAPVPAV